MECYNNTILSKHKIKLENSPGGEHPWEKTWCKEHKNRAAQYKHLQHHI